MYMYQEDILLIEPFNPKTHDLVFKIYFTFIICKPYFVIATWGFLACKTFRVIANLHRYGHATLDGF